MAKAKHGPQDAVERPLRDLGAKDNPGAAVGWPGCVFPGADREERSEAAAASQVPGEEVTPSGASYNPSFEDPQTLLWEAHEVELQRQKEAEKLEPGRHPGVRI